MKVRTGFVSNSGSSSFVIIGKKVGNLFTDKLELDDNKEYYVIGAYLCEGIDIIRLDKKLLRWLKEHYEKNDRESIDSIDGDVIEAVWSMSEPSGNNLPPIPEGNRIWEFTIDQSWTYDVSDAERNYPPKE